MYLAAEVGEGSADILSKFLAEGSAGMLEGEQRTKAEVYIAAIREAHETLKEMEAEDASRMDFNEALKRQAAVYVDGIRESFSGTMKDTMLGEVKTSTKAFVNKMLTIAMPRPPAVAGRLPVTGQLSTSIRIPLRTDYRMTMGQDEWSGDTAGRLHLSAYDEGFTTGHSYQGLIPGGCLRKELPFKYGRKTLANVSDGTSRLAVYYVMLVYIDHGSWELRFTITEPGAQEVVAGRDPNLLALYQAGVPPHGRFLAMASGIVSGGTTGPNQIVNLVQGLTPIPDHIEQSQLLVFALFKLIDAMLLQYLRVHFGTPPAIVGPVANWPHAGEDAANIAGAGYKFFGGTTWADHTRTSLLNWWKENSEQPQWFLIYNRLTELDSVEQRRLLHELCHNFPTQLRGYVDGAALARHGPTAEGGLVPFIVFLFAVLSLCMLSLHVRIVN